MNEEIKNIKREIEAGNMSSASGLIKNNFGEHQWEYHYWTSICLLKSKKPEQAEESIEAANNIENNKYIRRQMGYIKTVLNKREEALGIFSNEFKSNRCRETIEDYFNCLYRFKAWSIIVETNSSLVKDERNYTTNRIAGKAHRIRHEYKSALKYLESATKEKEEWELYIELGQIYSAILLYDKSVEAFKKSVRLKNSGFALNCLGWAQMKKGDLVEAEMTFKYAININVNSKEISDSYRGCSAALMKQGKIEDALNILENNIEHMSRNGLAKDLGWAYERKALLLSKCGREDEAKREWIKYFKIRKPTRIVDPTCGNGAKFTSISRTKLEEIHKKCEENGFTFLTSGRQEKYQNSLLYIHIPKCAGTSFIEPLQLMQKVIERTKTNLSGYGNKKILSLQELAEGENAANQLQAIVEIQKENKNLKLDHVFLTLHNKPTKFIKDRVEEIVSGKAEIITTTRCPRRRLYSNIKYHAPKAKNPSELRRYIENNLEEFDNHMSRVLFGTTDVKEVKIASEDEIRRGNIRAFDIKDTSSTDKIRRLFLSQNMYPNILQVSKLNESKNRGNHSKHDDTIREITEELIASGFTRSDEAVDWKKWNRVSKEKIDSQLSESNEQYEEINSSTFVILDENRHTLMETNKLLQKIDRIIENYRNEGR